MLPSPRLLSGSSAKFLAAPPRVETRRLVHEACSNRLAYRPPVRPSALRVPAGHFSARRRCAANLPDEPLSTTAALMVIDQPAAAGSGRAWRVPGGDVATLTNRVPQPRARAWPTPIDTAVAGPPGSSTARALLPRPGRPPRLLTTPGRPSAFWVGLHLGPQDGQIGVRQQRQRDVAMPACPAPDFVLVQPHLALGRLDGLLD